jgi:hypothetical protein
VYVNTRADLQKEVIACRRAWRRRWERFWLLRYENFRRSPSWRVEEETRAWHASRDDVLHYAELRAELAALRRANSRRAEPVTAE